MESIHYPLLIRADRVPHKADPGHSVTEAPVKLSFCVRRRSDFLPIQAYRFGGNHVNRPPRRIEGQDCHKRQERLQRYSFRFP